MGVGEQQNLHGVEPNALPTAARILHARVRVRIVMCTGSSQNLPKILRFRNGPLGVKALL